MKKSCPICGTADKVSVEHHAFPGYLEGRHFAIFFCLKCNVQFIAPPEDLAAMYQKIYAGTDIPGYDRYRVYADKVVQQDQPLRFLAEQESTYYPVYEYFKQHTEPQYVLEVGCGYGYTSYAMKALGHDVRGIDLSEESIAYAKEHYGDYFSVDTLETLGSEKKFDVIVATELIEHLEDPKSFLKSCSDLLTPEGVIIITTPNKNWAPKNALWRTDLPPVHTVWLSKESFQKMAMDHNLNISFTDFSHCFSQNGNWLAEYWSNVRHARSLPQAILNKDGYLSRKRLPKKIQKIKKALLHFAPIKYLSNYVAAKLLKEHKTLGVVLSKKAPN